eukprot:g7064.t1
MGTDDKLWAQLVRGAGAAAQLEAFGHGATLATLGTGIDLVPCDAGAADLCCVRGVYAADDAGVARLVARGRAALVTRLGLGARVWVGPTCMEPCCALAMCAAARVRPGSLVLDPMAGSGGIALAAAALGAHAVSAEAERALLEGDAAAPGLAANWRQQNLPPPEAVAAAVAARCAWRRGFDALVTDPPYGQLHDDGPGLATLHARVVALARACLVPGGRLVFCFPAADLVDARRQARGWAGAGLRCARVQLLPSGSKKRKRQRELQAAWVRACVVLELGGCGAAGARAAPLVATVLRAGAGEGAGAGAGAGDAACATTGDALAPPLAPSLAPPLALPLAPPTLPRDPDEALGRACWRGDTAQLAARLAGRCPDAEVGGTRLLVHAAGRGQAAAVEWLLSAGARVHHEAEPALHRAMRFGHSDAARALLAAGASLADQDAEGKSALDWAVKYGHVTAAGELLTASPVPAAVLARALGYARSEAAVVMLLAFGVAPQAGHVEAATRRGDAAVVAALTAAGAPVGRARLWAEIWGFAEIEALVGGRASHGCPRC